MIGVIPSLFFPAPSAILQTLIQHAASGELFADSAKTLTRLFGGLFLGGIPGLALGLAMGYSQKTRAIIDPFVAAVHPIPKLALFPLIMIIFGIGELSKLVAIGIGVFFPMLINAMAGVRNINPIHFEVAQNFGASAAKLVSRVILPGSLPLVLAGLRLAFNTGLLITIAIELLSSREGLGAMIWLGWQTFRPEEIYAGIVMIALLGVGVNLVIQRTVARLVPWQEERQS